MVKRKASSKNSREAASPSAAPEPDAAAGFAAWLGISLSAQELDNLARRRGLANLARLVFIDRNAQGMPKADRLKIKANARPHLRRAIAHLRTSRNALRRGDIAVHECERDRARMHAAFAQICFFQPYANKVGRRFAKLEVIRRRGALETGKKYAKPMLDDLIRGCLHCGEKTRPYTKEWASAFKVSVDTVERHIKKIKSEHAATAKR